jgi:hypothetical protein
MSIVTSVLLSLDALLEIVLLLLRAFGQAFVEFMFEALEKPWLVKR